MALIIGAFFTSLTPSAAFTLIAKLAEKKSEIPAFNGLMLQVQGAGILFGPSITGWSCLRDHMSLGLRQASF